MAFTKIIVLALLVAVATAQMPVQGFFSVPSTPFNRGGRVNFQGLSLGQVCKQIMMLGGKEALSDGMGAAAKWFANQKIAGSVAGGTDPQMQCLYSQATGGMMPGMIGAKDPGNMFGDYYDTVIEYPMIMDPCTAPQCNGKVNPTALLMQAYAPMMRNSMMGGFGNPMMGNTNMMGAAPTMTNPFANNPLLSALMPKANAGTNTVGGIPNATGTQPAAVPGTTVMATQPTAPAAPAPAPTQPANPFGNMMSMFQNPQMMQMFQQFMAQSMPGMNPGMNPAMNAAVNPAQANPFAALTGGMGGFPGLNMMGSLFL